MKKYILGFLLVIWACSFYSCSEDPILTSPGGGTFTPTITTPSSVIDGSTITISWGGNEFARNFSYRYKLTTDAWPEENAWSEWSSTTELIIDNMDEGEYLFQVKSRFEVGTESSPSSFEFEINAVTGPALRFFPLYKKVSSSSQFTMDIYVEDVEALTGAEIVFTYDPDYVSFDSVEAGSTLLTSANNILIEESQTGSVLLTLATYEDNGTGITGSGSLVQLSFTAIGPTSSPLEFNISASSFFIQNSGVQAEIENSFLSLHNATIVIE